MGRAPCCDKANVKKGPWSPEEDAKLKSYIHQNGTGGNWIALPQKIGLKRCGKSCRLRWLNYLRPNIKHGGFSEDEDNIICSLYLSIGSRWSIIAAQLPGRTDNDIKNYWNTRLKKKLLGKQRKEQQAQAHRRLKQQEIKNTQPFNNYNYNNNNMMMLNMSMNQTSTPSPPTPSWSPHHQQLPLYPHHHTHNTTLNSSFPSMNNIICGTTNNSDQLLVSSNNIMFEGFQNLEGALLESTDHDDYYGMLMLDLESNIMHMTSHVTNNNGSSTTTTTTTTTSTESSSWGDHMSMSNNNSLLYSPTLLPDEYQAPSATGLIIMPPQHAAFHESSTYFG